MKAQVAQARPVPFLERDQLSVLLYMTGEAVGDVPAADRGFAVVQEFGDRPPGRRRGLRRVPGAVARREQGVVPEQAETRTIRG